MATRTNHTSKTGRRSMSPAALMAAMRGDTDNAVVAMTPGGIEHQLQEGQDKLLKREELPIQINGITAELMAARLGFEWHGRATNSPTELFQRVTLPPGWKKQRTDHSMWSNLLDSKGCKRGSVFYKAAFYDQHAFMSLEPRYYVTSTYPEPMDWENGTKQVFIIDNETNQPVGEVFTIHIKDDELEEKTQERLRSEMRTLFPHCADVCAYWTDQGTHTPTTSENEEN